MKPSVMKDIPRSQKICALCDVGRRNDSGDMNVPFNADVQGEIKIAINTVTKDALRFVIRLYHRQAGSHLYNRQSFRSRTRLGVERDIDRRYEYQRHER